MVCRYRVFSYGAKTGEEKSGEILFDFSSQVFSGWSFLKHGFSYGLRGPIFPPSECKFRSSLKPRLTGAATKETRLDKN